MSEHAEEIRLLDSVYSSFPEVAKDLDFTLKEMWDYEPHQRNEAWTMLHNRIDRIGVGPTQMVDTA